MQEEPPADVVVLVVVLVVGSRQSPQMVGNGTFSTNPEVLALVRFSFGISTLPAFGLRYVTLDVKIEDNFMRLDPRSVFTSQIQPSHTL